MKRIVDERIVDTRIYRYVLKEYPNRYEIIRLPLEDLGTTNAIDGWELVDVIK